MKKYYRQLDSSMRITILDYLYNRSTEVPLYVKGQEIGVKVEIDKEDCFVTEEGIYIPYAYEETYRGSNDTDDRTENSPLYFDEPTILVEKISWNWLAIVLVVLAVALLIYAMHGDQVALTNGYIH
jgi:hypothetical protein